jgi:transmembrane sensor
MQGTAQTRRIEQEARAWLVFLHSGKAAAADYSAFRDWLGRDRAHAEAYRACEQLMGDLSLIAIDPAGAGLSTPRPPLNRAERRSVRHGSAGRRIAAAGGVLAATFAIAAILFTTTPEPAPHAIATNISEIREIMLEDGSKVTLGARSRVSAQFSDSLRIVTLVEGEAYFDVEKDPARPFYVKAGDRLVRVVGTEFNVRTDEGRVSVTVAEGVVQVMQGSNPEAAEQKLPEIEKAVLKAGARIVADAASGEVRWAAVEPERAALWRDGWLTYEDARLSDIVADINRYSERPIVFADPAIGDLRATAAFGSDQVAHFVDGLEASYPIEVDRSEREQITLRERK